MRLSGPGGVAAFPIPRKLVAGVPVLTRLWVTRWIGDRSLSVTPLPHTESCSLRVTIHADASHNS
jgi:hypothetical protein